LRKGSYIHKVLGHMTEKVTVLSIGLVRAAQMLRAEKSIHGTAGTTMVPRAVISYVFARFAMNVRRALPQKMKIMRDGVNGIIRAPTIAACSSDTA
jgi:hypothetical protein